ncbi:helix-turn-helix domain-containing protein [Salipiger manganoxidans]|nr:helix-turn-helix domain-containing protein [Salipiger manganoxidans]
MSDRIDTALRERLKYELRLRGHNFSSIAVELGVSFGAISSCVSGAMKSQKIQAAVARKLGKEPAEIWPDRYRQPEEKNSTKSRKEGSHPET